MNISINIYSIILLTYKYIYNYAGFLWMLHVCYVTASAPKHVNFLLTIHFLAGRWSTSGPEGGNAHFLPLQEYDRGGAEKIEGQTNKHEQCLGLTQEQKESYAALCIPDSIYGLTLAWVTSENSTKQLECRLILTQSSSLDPIFCYCVRSRPHLSVSSRQLPVSSFLQPTLFRVPLPLPDTARFQVQKPFVWFRARTDKGIVCLAGQLYSVTCFLLK